ncbi:MAG: LLM class flavin-dependent oxidoreductase [Acidimicrobiales bacterium]
MQIGLYAHTHGLGYREGVDNRTASTPAATLQPAAVAADAERSGFHSMWFPDHVCMPMQTGGAHVANVTGKRSYQPRHDLLDAAVVMGAVATVTTTLKLGTSVLVAPYRGPLQDIRQFTTVDVLSNGRLLLGVGEGWMAESSTALGIDPAEKGRRTVEVHRDLQAVLAGRRRLLRRRVPPLRRAVDGPETGAATAPADHLRRGVPPRRPPGGAALRRLLPAVPRPVRRAGPLPLPSGRDPPGARRDRKRPGHLHVMKRPRCT